MMLRINVLQYDRLPDIYAQRLRAIAYTSGKA